MDNVLNPGAAWKRSQKRMNPLSVQPEPLLRGPHVSFAIGGADGRQHEDKKGTTAAMQSAAKMNSTVTILAVVALAFVIFRSK